MLRHAVWIRTMENTKQLSIMSPIQGKVGTERDRQTAAVQRVIFVPVLFVQTAVVNVLEAT